MRQSHRAVGIVPAFRAEVRFRSRAVGRLRALTLFPAVWRSPGSRGAMQRLQVVLGHLNYRPNSGSHPRLQASQCRGDFPRPSADDVVVVHGRRTAIGRGGRGSFKVRPWDPAPGVRRLLCSVPLGSVPEWGRVAGVLGLGAPPAWAHRGRASRCRTPPPTSFSRRS